MDSYYSMFPEKKVLYEGMTMLKRTGEPLEVADVVVFHLSSKSSCKDHSHRGQFCDSRLIQT